MADYYTSFSFVLDLPGAEAIKYAIDLATIAEALRWESEEDRQTRETQFPKELEVFLDGWDFEVAEEKSGIWIHSNDGGTDAACHFVQHLLDRFGIIEPVSFEWANTCNKPRLDAYGGGAAVVTATEIKAISTCQWVFKRLERMRKTQERKPLSPGPRTQTSSVPVSD
jgi:hypothetical protein